MDKAQPAAIYQERAERFGVAHDRIAARWNLVANWRLALMVLIGLVLGVGSWYGSPALLWLGGGLVIGFLALVVYHNRLRDQRDRLALRRAISREGIARLQRNWEALPLRRPADPPPDHPTARDLDILGPTSLQHLLNTPRTPAGMATLQDWLLNPADPGLVRARQQAVAELSRQIELRDDLAAAGNQAAGHERSFRDLVEWATSPTWLQQRPLLRWAARLSPFLLIGLIAAQAGGLLTAPLWIAALGLNLLLSVIGMPTWRTQAALLDRYELIQAYSALCRLVSAADWQAAELQRLQRQLHADGLRAEQQLARLGRIAVLAEYSRSILFPILQFVGLWSYHVCDLAERWQRVSGGHVQAWLQTLGELEALCALATLQHDHPEWCTPELISEARISAAAIGHPLLPPERCVRNDVGLGPPGSFLLITGSNMAGKSTLLRAIGMNLVLAQAGGPVCAAQLHLPPLTLASSMRVQDSLAQGVSYFMAELRRLKAIIDQAAAAAERGLVCCYLLDEILQGTNSAERQIAARRVIRHLIGLGAIGAVSTHDLSLADVADLGSAAQLAHLAEQLQAGQDDGALHFDYQLRPGLAPSTNALRLMELVGLPSDDVQAVSVNRDVFPLPG